VVAHARQARESGERTIILFNLSGHGIFDLSAYDSFLSGKMP
jgi:tryptophan synthase beta chain